MESHLGSGAAIDFAAMDKVKWAVSCLLHAANRQGPQTADNISQKKWSCHFSTFHSLKLIIHADQKIIKESRI